jgi:hypothetical protein
MLPVGWVEMTFKEAQWVYLRYHLIGTIQDSFKVFHVITCSSKNKNQKLISHLSELTDPDLITSNQTSTPIKLDMARWNNGVMLAKN